jgi:polysaccharide biosynthesis/export protein
MKPICLLIVCGVSSCYLPAGRFMPVETYVDRVSPEYLIAPGDVLQVTVFQQESMSARVRVRPDGQVSLPLLNDWAVAGKSPRALGAELELKLKDYINKPSVRVSLEETRPLQVSIIGEVLRPGALTLDPNAGVLQALAAGGGLTEFAHKDGIFVVRSTLGSTPLRVRFTFNALARGEGRGSTFRLVPGDVVVVE